MAPHAKWILRASKHEKRFECAVSSSTAGQAVYWLEKYGWTVAMGDAPPSAAGTRMPD